MNFLKTIGLTRRSCTIRNISVSQKITVKPSRMIITSCPHLDEKFELAKKKSVGSSRNFSFDIRDENFDEKLTIDSEKEIDNVGNLLDGEQVLDGFDFNNENKSKKKHTHTGFLWNESYGNRETDSVTEDSRFFNRVYITGTIASAPFIIRAKSDYWHINGAVFNLKVLKEDSSNYEYISLQTKSAKLATLLQYKFTVGTRVLVLGELASFHDKKKDVKRDYIKINRITVLEEGQSSNPVAKEDWKQFD